MPGPYARQRPRAARRGKVDRPRGRRPLPIRSPAAPPARRASMKLANLAGRAAVVTDAGTIDVEQASGGTFGSGIQPLFDRWAELVAAAAAFDEAAAVPLDGSRLGPPVPAPRQVFAIGLNYGAHAAETGRDAPAVPATFTKFPAAINGPFGDIEVPAPTTDWEVELV